MYSPTYFYPRNRFWSNWPAPVWGWRGYPAYWGYGGYGGYNSNIIGSAIANQNMNIIGSPGGIGNQVATPTVIW